MKKIVSMAAAIILATTAFAAGGENEKPVTHQATYQQSFKSLEVKNGIEVVLVESSEKFIEFTGTDANLANVNWKIKNGTLIVSGRNGKNLKGKVKLLVNVNQLKDVVIAGGSELRSAGELNSANLRIRVDGNCFISVRNKGNINIINDTDTELEVQRVVGDVIFG